MAFLPSLGFLGFEIHIFYCNTPCLVWLPIQHRRKPISREPDFSVQKQGFLDGFLALSQGYRLRIGADDVYLRFTNGLTIFYGAGLRLLECLQLRIKDVTFGSNEIVVRSGK